MTTVQDRLQVRTALTPELVVRLVEQQSRMSFMDHAKDRGGADRTIQFGARRQTPQEVQRRSLAAVLAGSLKRKPRRYVNVEIFSL